LVNNQLLLFKPALEPADERQIFDEFVKNEKLFERSEFFSFRIL